VKNILRELCLREKVEKRPLLNTALLETESTSGATSLHLSTESKSLACLALLLKAG
jgi:hypothetical protein